MVFNFAVHASEKTEALKVRNFMSRVPFVFLIGYGAVSEGAFISYKLNKQ